MTHRHRWLIRYLAAFAALVIRAWMGTMRARMVSADGQEHPANPSVTRYLYAFWHEGLLAPLAVRDDARKIKVLISQHTDGEFIAQICQRLGIGVIRGSPARGGSQALLNMIRDVDESAHLGITPDGPRGPRRQLKQGAVMVASQSRLPIVPIGIGFVKAWRFGSWDRFALPVPGSTMVGVVGEPIVVPGDLDRGGLTQWTQLVENRLSEATELAEGWALRIRRDGHRAAPPVLVPSSALRRSA